MLTRLGSARIENSIHNIASGSSYLYFSWMEWWCRFIVEEEICETSHPAAPSSLLIKLEICGSYYRRRAIRRIFISKQLIKFYHGVHFYLLLPFSCDWSFRQHISILGIRSSFSYCLRRISQQFPKRRNIKKLVVILQSEILS